MHIPRTHSLRRACSIYVHCRRGDWRRGGRRETRPKKRSPTNTPLVFFAPPCSTDYSTILRALAGQRLAVLPHDHEGLWGRESPLSLAHRTACGLTHAVRPRTRPHNLKTRATLSTEHQRLNLLGPPTAARRQPYQRLFASLPTAG